MRENTGRPARPHRGWNTVQHTGSTTLSHLETVVSERRVYHSRSHAPLLGQWIDTLCSMCLQLPLKRESHWSVSQHGSWQLKFLLSRWPLRLLSTCESAASGPDNILPRWEGETPESLSCGGPGQGRHTDYSRSPSIQTLFHFSHIVKSCVSKCIPVSMGFFEVDG